MYPSQNTGSAETTYANIVSGQESLFMPRTAEYRAMGIAMRRVTSMEPIVRMMVLSPTRSSSPETGRPVRTDVPKFPWSILKSHERYWEYHALGTPSASRTPARAESEDIWPSSRMLNGSPGDRNRMMKTTKLTPRSRNAVITSSLDTTRAMGLIAGNL